MFLGKQQKLIQVVKPVDIEVPTYDEIEPDTDKPTPTPRPAAPAVVEVPAPV